MGKMWVTSPEDRNPVRLARVEAEGARVQAELEAIERGAVEESCRICASTESLTDEHAPSRKAGNIDQLVRGTIDYAASVETGKVAWMAELLQGGARGMTLCRTCNNSTGRWYNPAYIRLVDQCRAFAVPEKAGGACDIALDLHPQRASKQALTSVLSTSQPGVTARYPHLREMLLNAEAVSPLAPLRLWLYLRANPGGRSTGIVPFVEIDRLVGRLLAEFSFWPLGWVLAFDDVPVDGAVDVSPWFEVGFHDRRQFTLSVPCQWAMLSYPTDFRSPEAILAERAGRQAAVDGRTVPSA